jgi:hypothetical protein
MSVLEVENGLILETAVLEKEIASAATNGDSILRIIPEKLEPIPDLGALGDCGEVTSGELVLRDYPTLGFRGIDILEPSIRIRNGCAEIVVYVV